VLTFAAVVGFFLRFEDDSVESAKTVKQWNVKIISVSTITIVDLALIFKICKTDNFCADDDNLLLILYDYYVLSILFCKWDLQISKNKRHQDRAAALEVWEKLEEFMRSRSH